MAHSYKGGVFVKLAQTDFAGKPTLEMEGGTARFSLQQARSAYVHTLVMSCRGGCKPPGPQLQYHLVGLGQQIFTPALFCHLLTMGQSRAHPEPSTPSHPSACRDRKHHWDLPSKASSSAGRGNCPKQHQGPPSPTGTPTPVRKAGSALHCHRDTVGPRQHSSPGQAVSLCSTQACCS